MMATSNKLEEIHANLWKPYDLSSQLESIYIAILIYEYMQKT